MAKNKPFVGEDEERKTSDESKEAEEAHKNEEVKAFWMTFALCTMSSYIGK